MSLYSRTPANEARTEPPSVRLHAAWCCLIFAFLERSRLDDLAILVPDGLAASEHLRARDLFRIAVEVLALDFLDVRLG